MFLASNVKLGDYVRISALGKKKLVIGTSANIGDFTQVIISSSFDNIGEFILIGDHVGIGEFSYLGGGGGLNIGNGTIIGQYFSAHPENHNFDNPVVPIRSQGVSRKGIVIGENCWIGSKVTILDGVELGANCIVAAGSVVTKSFKSNDIVAGVPAKVVGNRISAKK
ncbi:DapH/DapD/GlmU-related protein [Aurantivibrio infirmus]